MEKKEKEK